MVCVTTSSSWFSFLFLRASLKTVLYICSLTLLCSGRRYGFTFSGYVFHVTICMDQLISIACCFQSQFALASSPLLWNYVYETRSDFRFNLFDDLSISFNFPIASVLFRPKTTMVSGTRPNCCSLQRKPASPPHQKRLSVLDKSIGGCTYMYPTALT